MQDSFHCISPSRLKMKITSNVLHWSKVMLAKGSLVNLVKSRLNKVAKIGLFMEIGGSRMRGGMS